MTDTDYLSQLTDSSSGLNGILSGNSDIGDKKPEKPSSTKPLSTAELRKDVDAATSKLDENEKKRENTLLPGKPDLKEAPKPENFQTDPMQKFGSAGTFLAVFGSMLTRKPLTNALNGAAAVNTAINEGDASKFKQAYDEWKVNNENAWKMADWEHQQYKDTIDQIDAGDKNAEAKLRLQAIAMNNPSMKQAIEGLEYRNLNLAYGENVLKFKDNTEKYEIEAGYKNDAIQTYKTANGGKMPQGADMSKILQDAREKSESGTGDFGKTQQSADEREAYKNAYEKAKTAGKDDTEARLEGEKARGQIITAAKGGVMKGVPTISDDTADFVARQFIASGGKPSTLSGWGRGEGASANLAMIHNKVPALAKEMGISPEKLVQMDLELTKLRAEEQTLGHQTAKVTSAGEEFDTIAEQVIETSDKVNRTEYPSLNKIIETVEAGGGSTEVVDLYAAVLGASNTYARAINPNGVGRVEDQTHFMKAMNDAYSKGQIKTAINRFTKETEAARDAPPKVQKAIDKQLDTMLGGKSSSGDATPTDEDIAHLKDNPSDKASFDKYFGAGAADKALGK